MNRKAKAREARRHADLREACEPLMDELDAAKQAVRDAVTTGDQGAAREARQRLATAGRQVRQTRMWLRSERRAAECAAVIDDLGGRPPHLLSDKETRLLEAARRDLPRAETIAAPFRQAAAVFGQTAGPVEAGQPGPGDAHVSMSTVAGKARAREVR